MWGHVQRASGTAQADSCPRRAQQAGLVEGDVVVVGAYGSNSPANDSGAAYVFERSNGVWSEQQKLVALDIDGNGSWR